MENNINRANTPGLAAQVLARYRQTAQKFGPFFGQQIFTIVAQTPDLKWKEDVATGKNTFRQEVKAYILKAIDVESVSLLEKDVDGRPKIILNEKKNDPSLVFELADPEFTKATRQNVIECIERLSKPGSKPMFFTAEELPMLNDLTKLSNQSVLNFYEEMTRKCMQLAETVRSYIDMNQRMQVEYLRQCGLDNQETEIHVTATITEEKQQKLMNGRLSSLRVELLRILICSEPAILSKIQIWNGGRTETPKKVSIREDGRVFLFYGSGPLWWQRLFNTYESVSIIDASISIADAITGSNSTRNEYAFDEITKSIIDEAKKRKDFDCIVDILFDCMRNCSDGELHSKWINQENIKKYARENSITNVEDIDLEGLNGIVGIKTGGRVIPIVLGQLRKFRKY